MSISTLSDSSCLWHKQNLATLEEKEECTVVVEIGSCAMNCVGDGKAFSIQAFRVSPGDELTHPQCSGSGESSAKWTNEPSLTLEAGAIDPPSGGPDIEIASSVVVMDLHFSLCALTGSSGPLWAMARTSEDTRIPRVALSWYMRLATSLATSEPVTKKTSRFPCKLKPGECVTHFLSSFVWAIKGGDKTLL